MPMLATAGPARRTAPAGRSSSSGTACGPIVAAAGDAVRLTSRLGNDVTAGYPELAGIGALTGGRPVLLDGEIVALDAAGRPNFGLLQDRMHVRHPTPELRGRIPVSFYAFDLLHLDGESLLAAPYDERRARLAELAAGGPRARAPVVHRRRRRPAARGRPRARPGGRRRQAPGRPLRGRPPLAGRGSRPRCRTPRRCSSADGRWGRGGAPARSARCCWVPTTPTAACATSATSAPGSATRRSTTCMAPPAPARPPDQPVRRDGAARARPPRPLGRAGAGRRGRVPADDPRRPAASRLVARPAAGPGARRGRAAGPLTATGPYRWRRARPGPAPARAAAGLAGCCGARQAARHARAVGTGGAGRGALAVAAALGVARADPPRPGAGALIRAALLVEDGVRSAAGRRPAAVPALDATAAGALPRARIAAPRADRRSGGARPARRARPAAAGPRPRRARPRRPTPAHRPLAARRAAQPASAGSSPSRSPARRSPSAPRAPRSRSAATVTATSTPSSTTRASHRAGTTSSSALDGGAPVRAPVLVVAPDVRLGLVSDVDDTILETGLTRGLAFLRITLLTEVGERAPLPGAAALYRALVRRRARRACRCSTCRPARGTCTRCCWSSSRCAASRSGRCCSPTGGPGAATCSASGRASTSSG